MLIWDELSQELEILGKNQNLRSLRLVEPLGLNRAKVDGRELTLFASNDYLGLSRHPDVISAAKEALDTYGTGAGASRLISGHNRLLANLEAALAAFKGGEAALVFASGTLANYGLLGSLAGPHDAILLDKSSHASLYDGARLSGARVLRFSHQDLVQLEKHLLDSADSKHRWIVVESVYSMDGDLAPLPELFELAEKYDAMLIVDEAHATGVIGGSGKGSLDYFRLAWHPRLIVSGTLSKALGAQGGFVVGPKILVQSLINKSRPFIFSTGLAPAAAGAAQAALKIISTETGLLAALKNNVTQLRQLLRQQGWLVDDGPSAIIALITGDAVSALNLQKKLFQAGFWAPAIRQPTVPAGRCRIRLTLSSGHRDEDIRALARAIGAPLD